MRICSTGPVLSAYARLQACMGTHQLRTEDPKVFSTKMLGYPVFLGTTTP